MSAPMSPGRTLPESFGGRRTARLLTRIGVTLAATLVSIAMVPNAVGSTDSVWTAQPSERLNILTCVDFVSPSTGWVVGENSTILKTTNGGRSWVDQSQPTGGYSSVDFINSSTGWVVGHAGFIIKTTNGGTTWTDQSLASGAWLESVKFVSASTGWVVGRGGVIYKTSNGGATWTLQVSGTDRNFWSVDFVDANNGWAAGDEGHIVHTTDGGANWTPQTPNLNQDYKCIRFINASTGWAVGLGGGIIHTTTGGNTWLPQVSGTASQLHSVCFVDANNGWATGYTPGGTAPMLSTTNGGATWTVGTWPGTDWLFSIQFFDASTGWAVGWAGTIIHLGALPNPAVTLTTKTVLSGPASVKVHKTLKLTGTVTPSAAPGKVTIKKTRLVGKTWKSEGSPRVSVVNGTFSYSFKPTHTGKWRFTAGYSGGVVGLTTYKSSKSSTRGVAVN